MPEADPSAALPNTNPPDAHALRFLLAGLVGFLFLIEIITGTLLMTVYSPSTTTAWSSVWYVQTQVQLGWLIRGMHRFSSDALMILLPLWIAHAVIRRRYGWSERRAWWSLLALSFITMFLALSGYTLPWDQHGYWGTKVRTGILALTPLVGDTLRDLLLGGNEPGHLTLTRFYTLHVAVLPIAFFLLWRMASGRRPAAGGDETASPATRTRLLRAIPRIAALAAIVGVTVYVHEADSTAMLAAPADPSGSDYPARPEWFNLFLFQWLKGFHGPVLETVGAVVVPGLIVVLFLLFPYTEKLLRPRAAHMAVGLFSTAVAVAIVALTVAAIRADRDPSDNAVQAVRAEQRDDESLTAADRAILRAREFNRQKARAREVARRAVELANRDGIPPQGPLVLLENDPLTRGPELFAAHCASCHRFDGHNGLGAVPLEPPTSSDLAGFATRSWVRGLLADPMADRYFGRMKKPDGSPAHTKMAEWVADTRAQYEAQGKKKELDRKFDAVAAYLEYESLNPGGLSKVPTRDTEQRPPVVESLEQKPHGTLILEGRRYFAVVCNECHRYDGENTGFFKAPEMLGYGSVEWLELMIAQPDHELRYRSRGAEPAQMPRFADRLTADQRRLIAAWLHQARETGAPRDRSDM